MRDLRVFVSGVSGIVGYGIARSLKRAYPEISVFGTALDSFNVGAQLVDVFSTCPPSNSDVYIPWLSQFLRENEIDYAFPGIDADMHLWNLNREVFADVKCVPILNDANLICITEDKFKFYLEIEKYNFPHTIPTRDFGTFAELCDAFGSSKIIAKPKVGFAKKGFRTVHSASELEEAISGNPGGLVFQPNLYSDGYEYTSSVFGDGKGSYSSIITLHRRLAAEGYSSYGTYVPNSDLEGHILDYCRILKPIGPTNFQFMETEGGFYLLEINPRFSSSTSMRTVLGYNESKMAIDFYDKGSLPEQPVIRSGTVIRFVEELYVSR